MSAWTELTVAVVENAMPTDLATLYRTWFDANPPKANRLVEIVDEVRSTYRRAVEVNPANRMDENPNTVPTVGFRHALNSVIFHMGMEMGVQFAPEVYTLITRGEIWLRMVQNGGILVDIDGSGGTPSYVAPEGGRALVG
jgi:hypothetical protein